VRRPLIALFFAALLVRAAFVVLEPSTRLVGDEQNWTALGIDLATPPGVLSPLRPSLLFHSPLYPYFVGALYALFGALGAVKWAQVVLGALMVPAVARIGRASFGAPVGLVAAGITAFYPELVWYCAHFWTEILFATLLWWAVERLLAADVEERAWTAVVAGVLWGLAALARETALYFAPLAALWLAFGRTGGARRATLRAGVFLLASGLVVGAWTYRNWRVWHAFVPISTFGALNLWQGNTALARGDVYDRYYAVQDPIDRYRFARAQALQAILDRQPAWFFDKVADEMPRFWGVNDMLVVHLQRRAYGRFSTATNRAVFLLTALPYLGVLALSVLGLAALPRGRVPLLLVGLLVYTCLIHVATHGFTRFRIPILFVLFVFAAQAWVRWREGAGLSRRRRLAAAMIALALGAAVVVNLRETLAEPFLGLGASTPSRPAPPPEPGPSRW
jgi:hypothetical protein